MVKRNHFDSFFRPHHDLFIFVTDDHGYVSFVTINYSLSLVHDILKYDQYYLFYNICMVLNQEQLYRPCTQSKKIVNKLLIL